MREGGKKGREEKYGDTERGRKKDGNTEGGRKKEGDRELGTMRRERERR